MTTRKPPRADWIGLGAFALTIVVFVGVGPTAGLRVFGGWMAITALVQQATGRLPFGWEGPRPSPTMFAAMNALVGAIGLVLVFWTDGVMALAGMD